MRTGLKPFFISFLITLGVLLPFVWCGTLYYDTAHSSAEPAAQPQSGVPILSGSQDSGAFLIALAPWQECPAPSLAILRLDCPQAAISVCLLPPGTVVRSPGGSATLAQSYLTAGPGRAAQLLCETLELPPLSYVAATPGGWALLLGDPVLRLDAASLLTPAQRAALGLEGAVGQLSLPQAAALCVHGADLLPAESALKLRLAVWENTLQQCRPQLALLADAMRAQSSQLLTSLSATELLRLEKMLRFLSSAESVSVRVQTMPGKAEGQRFALNEQSLALAAQLAG